MKKIKCKIKGVAPLLQHRFREEQHGVNKSRGKKKVYIPEEEAETALYRNAKREIYEPSEHILGSLIKAGTSFILEGKKTYKDAIKGGIVVEPDEILLGKKKWDEIDARGVVINRARVVRWRPKFNDWKLEFDITILDEDTISPIVLKEIMEKAGQTGIGDYRPRFGRFQVVGWEEYNEKKLKK